MSDPQLTIEEPLVERLVADQFPQWAGLPVRRVAADGWDNRSFRLGEHLLVRLPSARRYAGQVAREQAALERLAPALPLPVPRLEGRGAPGQGYPHPWSVYAWLNGETLATTDLAASASLGGELGRFLCALRAAPADGGPAAGSENFHRGGELAAYDGQVQAALPRLPADLRASVERAWSQALTSRWQGPPVWVHGDYAPRNLLTCGRALTGVIDWGQVCVGDPACDLAIAWTWLRGEARAAFQVAADLDDDTWARARGWVAWKAAILLSGVAAGPEPDVRGAETVLRNL